MHEHELLKGHEKREKNAFLVVCTCWLSPGFFAISEWAVFVGMSEMISDNLKLSSFFRSQNSICSQFLLLPSDQTAQQ
jgi:hypothetical protein